MKTKKTISEEIDDLERAVDELGDSIKETWLAKKMIDIANKCMMKFNR